MSTDIKDCTGLLLGAGFSFELGMPLGPTLTKEIFEILAPERLRRLDEIWAQGGRELSEHVERLCKFMTLPHVRTPNYESILGHLESEDWFLRAQADRGTHTLKALFTDTINNILIGRHIMLAGFTMEMLRFYDGLLGLAQANSPLWIFTLNHDVMIELVAARLGLPVSGGFSDEKLHIQLAPAPGGESRHLSAEVIRNAHLKARMLNFFRRGTIGINLLKIHGALDIFTFNEGNDVLRILPHGDGADGILEALYNLNSQMPPTPPPRIPGGHFATDTDGNDLFLQASLVSGAHKFDARHPQVLPMDYLQIFETSLLHLDTLICIGYSFGDIHINLLIRGWLELSRDKRLVIVGPGSDVPAAFLHLADRVECKDMNATAFLQSCAALPLTPDELQIQEKGRSVISEINSHPPDSAAWAFWNQPQLWDHSVNGDSTER
jgi:hypothetical protein